MAEQAEREDDELELTDVVDDEAAQTGGDDSQAGGEEDDQIEGGDAEDEVEVIFGEEAAPASRGNDSELVRKLRGEIRKRDELLAASKTPQQPQVIEVGDKPTLESCDFEEDRYETELDAWKDRKRQADEADALAQSAQDANRAAWAAELEEFGRKRDALKVPDFEASEEAVTATLSQVQQAIVVKAADDPAKLIYALGRHPEKLATLAAITDPVKLIVAVVKLEGTLKVTIRRRAPAEIDTPERGSGQLSASTDKTLERLEKEADRTGDRTQVVAYKRKLRAQGRA